MKNPLFLAALLLGLLCHSDLVNQRAHADETATAKTEFKITQETSAELTEAGWNAFNDHNYEHTIAYAKECIKRYQKEAVAMQNELTEPVPASNNEAVLSKWALNDVGTCCFMLGQALEKQDKKKDALKAYKAVIEKFSFAQCWDPQGWFWKPADAAKKQIKTLEFALLEGNDE